MWSVSKPLTNQICNEFKECTTINKDKIILLTGATPPTKRIGLYADAIIITATPQTIKEDLENNRITLENFSLLTIDEAHRSRENFANTKVAKYYKKQNPKGRILALTASPGSTKAKIDEICKNLYIEAVERSDRICTKKRGRIHKYRTIRTTNVYTPFNKKYVQRKIKRLRKF